MHASLLDNYGGSTNKPNQSTESQIHAGNGYPYYQRLMTKYDHISIIPSKNLQTSLTTDEGQNIFVYL